MHDPWAFVSHGVVPQLYDPIVVGGVGDLVPHKAKLPENKQVFLHYAVGPQGPGVHK
uniref:Uncharacterized protein n=1 Tax=Human herpesvirus 1 TaxID=10298 RepID=A0A2Z4H063_HHV1|nr:hypothetical protein [Human alphaherpesvirus 1]AWW11007.1 hypothetical protein [Human alphaherpesvirus 1]